MDNQDNESVESEIGLNNASQEQGPNDLVNISNAWYKNKFAIGGIAMIVAISGYLVLGSGGKPSAQQCNALYDPTASVVGMLVSGDEYDEAVEWAVYLGGADELKGLAPSLPGRSGEWAREMANAVEDMTSQRMAGDYIGSSEKTIELFEEFRSSICPDLFE